MTEEFNEEEEMIINQQYKIWKKQAPNKYDFIILHSLDLPTYSFQWYPQTQTHQDCVSHFALIAPNSPDAQKCALMKVQIDIPNQNKCESYMQNKGNKIKVIQKIIHNGQINRARHCHGNTDLIAVSAANGDINLMTMKQNIGKLVGHASEGYGLSWNPLSTSLLASGQTDKKICIWDVQKNKKQNSKILPVLQIAHHNAPVQDVAWHKFHQNVLGSCSDDRLIMIWDTRFKTSGVKDDKKPLFEIVAHTNQVYSLDFSPFNQFLLLSGSGDETCSVWDMRNLTRSLSTFNGQKDSIIKVQWSPFISTVFASCGDGRTVDIWDLSREKDSQPQTQLDYPSLFRHGGHRSKVLDFDWNQNQKLLLGSTQQSNCLHIWQMAKSLYYQQE